MSELQQLRGHVTPEMKAAPIVGRVTPTNELTVTVGLVVDGNALTTAATQVSDPQSPTYRQYMTPEQVGDAFGAGPSDYKRLLDWGRSNGLVPVAHKNRFVATFTGPANKIERALHVQLNNGLRPDGTQFFGPDREPSLDLALPVEHISGLNNYKLPTRAGGSGSGGDYQGSDFRNAYAPGTALTGAGQSVGIFMLDGFAQSDITAYGKLLNQTFLPIQTVPANTSTTPGGEGTLDISMVLAMAPAVQVVAFVGNTTQILTNMTDREDIKQFSSSWFWYDGSTTDTNLMATLAMQGQSFFQASGDSGAYPANWPKGYVSGSLDCRQFPFITIVGGTDLNIANDGASYGTLETGWVDGSGGPIGHVPIPLYQLSIGGQNGASPTNRNAPDVSAQANGGTIVFDGAPAYAGGTSQATPLWAGFIALVNQQASLSLRATVGFANPTLYALAASSEYHTLFHDITSGCSIANASGTQYCSGPGYDLVTGLGSPTLSLIGALLSLPIVHPHLGGLGGPDPTIILVGVGGRTEVFPGIGGGGPIIYHED